jgi:hypothetical protein
MGIGGSPRRSRTLLAAFLCAFVGLAGTAGDAAAQFDWLWGKKDPAPRPKAQPPPDQLPPLQPGAPSGPPPSYGARPPVSNLCLQLEQRLVGETQGSGQGREQLPKIETDIRDTERALRSASRRLESSDCWETFLFSKTLRPNRQCRQLNDDVENARQRLADLDRQRKQIMGTGDSSMQDEIIRELARHGCGEQYVKEARKRDSQSNPFAMLFGGGEETEGPKGPGNNFGSLPFATYRTLCVRLCDGYYFPVSFSTLPNHFQRDAQLCQSQCAAPAELFYHQNPGGAVEQMVSFGSQQPYMSLRSAFRYRKEFVQGCSCKQVEYDPAVESLGEKERKKADASPVQRLPGGFGPPESPGAGVRVGAKK